MWEKLGKMGGTNSGVMYGKEYNFFLSSIGSYGIFLRRLTRYNLWFKFTENMMHFLSTMNNFMTININNSLTDYKQ